MINELIKEKHEQVDREEEAKIMDAIHRQAKDSYYMAKAKNYLKKKDTKKEFKARLINDSLNFVLFAIAVIPTLLLLIVLH